MGKGKSNWKAAMSNDKKACGRDNADRRQKSPSHDHDDSEVASQGAESQRHLEAGDYIHISNRSDRARGRYYRDTRQTNEYRHSSRNRRFSISYDTYETSRDRYPRRSSNDSSFETTRRNRASNQSGTQWQGAHTLNFATGFASGARKGIRREGRENPTAPRGVGRIGRGPIMVPPAMVAAAKVVKDEQSDPDALPSGVNAVPQAPDTFWDLAGEIEVDLEDLKVRFDKAVASHHPKSKAEEEFEEALQCCESKIWDLRRWKYAYVEKQVALRRDKTLELGSQLNKVIEDNIKECVNRAKREADRRWMMVAGDEYYKDEL